MGVTDLLVGIHCGVSNVLNGVTCLLGGNQCRVTDVLTEVIGFNRWGSLITAGATVTELFAGHRLDRWRSRICRVGVNSGVMVTDVLLRGCRVDRWGSLICWVGVTTGVRATDVLFEGHTVDRWG